MDPPSIPCLGSLDSSKADILQEGRLRDFQVFSSFLGGKYHVSIQDRHQLASFFQVLPYFIAKYMPRRAPSELEQANDSIFKG
jgi:hypothetical protein